LKDEALDLSLCRTRLGRRYGPVERYCGKNEWNVYICINEEITREVSICINITKLINYGSYCTSTVKNVVTSKGIKVGIECK